MLVECVKLGQAPRDLPVPEERAVGRLKTVDRHQDVPGQPAATG